MPAIFTWLGTAASGLLGAAFIASVASIFASVLAVFASLFTALTPIFTAITQFIVWFGQEFFKGLGVILTNLSTLAVLVVAIIASVYFVHSHDAKDCRLEVAKQKQVDYRHFAPLLSKNARPAPTPPKHIVVLPKARPRTVTPAPAPQPGWLWPLNGG